MSSKAWETTGIDVSRDRIVELAATQGHDLAHLPGASFSEVVRVPEEIQRSASAQAAAAVHGITDEEIALGSTFPEAWAFLCRKSLSSYRERWELHYNPYKCFHNLI